MRSPSTWLDALGWRERPVLLATLAGAGVLWAVLALTGISLPGGIRELDMRLLLLLRTPGAPSEPLGPAWFQEAVRDVSGLGGNSVLAIMTLSAAGYLVTGGRRRAALVLVGSVALALLATTLLKIGIDRPRPDLVPHATRVFTQSFPSSHATMSAVVYLTLGALLSDTQTSRAIRIYIALVALLLTLVVGASRVYLGVHWPSDVVGGWVIGAVWALASRGLLTAATRDKG